MKSSRVETQPEQAIGSDRLTEPPEPLDPLESAAPPVEPSGRRWTLVTAGLCILLVALVAICYRQTPSSYFLADDFGEIFYMSRIWSGEWGLYLNDWISNTMNVPGMAVYRPWFMTTLVAEYFFFRGNPVGYYISNIAYFAVDVVLLFLVVRQLTIGWSAPRSLTCSFFAAALFALSPLHCESVSWVGGRTDTVCATFFLSGILFFLLARAKDSTAWAVACVVAYWLGLLTKEMAIGLPVIASAIAWLYPLVPPHPETPFLPNLWQRSKDAINETSALWISTLGYFFARYLALGTLLGGYTAGIGQAQSAGALGTWADVDTYRRLFFPFAADIVSPQSSLATLLMVAYAGGILLFLIRAVRGQIPWRMLLVLGIWALAAALPIYRLWGIGVNLEGARYVFFLTIPGAMLLPLVLLAPSKKSVSPASNGERLYLAAVVAVLGLLAFVSGRVLNKTNHEWVAAGREVRAITSGARALAESLPATKEKVLVFSVPKTHFGAHMIYNGPTLMTALKPPFSEKNYESKLESTDHLFFGLDRNINSTHFKELLASGRLEGPYAWDLSGKKFFPVIYTPSTPSKAPLNLPLNTTPGAVQLYTHGHAQAATDGTALRLTNIQHGDGVRFGNLNANPLDIDFVELEYRLPSGAPGPLTFEARWQGADQRASNPEDLWANRVIESPAAASKENWQTTRIPVSHFWRWYSCGNIKAVSVFPMGVSDIEIRKLSLLPDTHIRPTLTISGSKVDGSGVHYVNSKSTAWFDASAVPGASGVRIECTKPEFFFDQGAGSKGGLHSSQAKTGNKISLPVTPALVPMNAFAEMRVQALDAKGQPLGEPSEPRVIFSR